MQTTLVPTNQLKPHANNPRKNDAAVKAVACSITQFGFRQPLVVTADYQIVVGHTRWKAAVKLGLEEVPVHIASNLSPEQIRAYRIADNKTGELADWDEALLLEELRALEALDMDPLDLGFSTEDLTQLYGESTNEGQTDPDLAPDPPAKATTRRGDLVSLGDHLLLCGDAASMGDVNRLVGEQKMEMVNSDPPYNVQVQPRGGQASTVQRPRDRTIKNDSVDPEQYQQLLNQWFGNVAEVLSPGGAFYFWGGYANCANYPAAMKQQGLHFSQAIIWVKEHPVISRKDFMGNHEWCFYGWKAGAAHRFYGPANATDVWSIKKVAPTQMLHLTEKPVALAERAIQYSTRPGANVLDVFGGSGSTLIAAERTGRRAFLMELDELYCDVIIRRWEDFTGGQAERRSTSGTIEEGVKHGT